MLPKSRMLTKRVESKFTFSEATAFMQYNFCGTLNLTFGLLLQISENREMFYSCFKGDIQRRSI